ncbi:MAG TPA: methyl-accepting chemotaxis protein [Candidatus Competibacteraceae bacterium]|nr:methyl-accepting chemotaxis protein [Candidatus Competibacteraceae bacterium]
MNQSRGGIPKQQKSAYKYVILLALLIVSITLMALTFVMVERGKTINNGFLALTGEQRLLSRSIVTQAFEAAQGDADAFDRLRDSKARFDELLDIQTNGRDGGEFALPAMSPATAPFVEDLTSQWKQIRANIDVILGGREAVLSVSQFVPLLEQLIPQLLTASDEVASNIIASGADSQQVYLATRQLLLGQRIESNLRRILAGGSGAATAADRFGRDVALFGRVLEGMAEGDPRLGVQPVSNAATAAKVRELKQLFTSVEEESGRILGNSPELFQVQNATQGIASQGDALLAKVEALLEHYRTGMVGSIYVLPGIPLSETWAYVLGAIAVLLLVALARLQNKEARIRLEETRQRQQETEEQNRRNQEAILRLLDELGDLAEGDLTVQASVTEDITGAIADSVNYAIEALRDLVSTINKTSEQMAVAAQETRGVADRLARASEVQARQIDSASNIVMQMAQAMDEVSERTASSAEVAEKSVGIAHEGGERVRRTIQGMDAIREHIQETSKRIKRLGESSQEIGDIVALINDIADQTNILALNAAIQASAAGEAGRGFAVVADEVQRLAERSGNATKRIEALVKTIQADTNEAIISMEKSTTEVVNGAGLAEKAGEALDEIETVSARLAELINEVSKSSGQVTEMASRVASAMTSINEITAQTSETSVTTAASVAKLNQLAQELQQSVAGFRLPAESA